MRKVTLTILFIIISHICTAPAIDLGLKMLKFRSMSVYVEKRHHELEYLRFINDLGHRESSNNWLSVNRIGCFGEWQFSESTLRYLGYKKITLRKFKANPNVFPRDLQLKALNALIKVNQYYLKDYQRFIGRSIKGIEITKSGMIAASHLGGAGSLKSFLKTNGRINRSDVFGTSISDYLRFFSNYDLE